MKFQPERRLVGTEGTNERDRTSLWRVIQTSTQDGCKTTRETSCNYWRFWTPTGTHRAAFK